MRRARDTAGRFFGAWRCCAFIRIAAGIVLLPTQARASCGIAPPVREAVENADDVFVGEVVRLENDGRTALVTVMDVWKGHVAERVVVHGGMQLPQQPDTYTSVDRTYELGKTYLFFPSEREERYFRDICTRTSVMRERFLRIRPEGASTPSLGSNLVTEDDLGITSPQLPRWLLLGAGVVLLAAGSWAWVSVRRRRT